MTDVEQRTLQAVARVFELIGRRGLRGALVGAAALAVHGYSRATEDVDIGVAAPSLPLLRAIADDVRATLGLDAEVALPDADDPLGVVVTIHGDDIRQIQIVNFLNPIGRGDHPGREAVQQPIEIELVGRRTAVVDLAHLVAMKLYAGGMKSKADVVELLAYNPDADLDAVAALCGRFGLQDEWAALLPEIRARRA